MVDASDSKSDDSNIMWVQVPSPVFFILKIGVSKVSDTPDTGLLRFHLYFQPANTLLATSTPE